jgi:iron(III) transport system substrate-binding protein
MSAPRIAVVAAFLLVVSLPFLVRPLASGGPASQSQGRAASDHTLVIVTPHVEQIRNEFAEGFARWHARVFPGDGPVAIDWRIPGGTSDIIKQLTAEYEAAVKSAARAGDLATVAGATDKSPAEVSPPATTMGTDAMLGGGSYEHGQLKRGIVVHVADGTGTRDVLVRLSEPAGFPKERLQGGPEQWFTGNTIGNQNLYDPDQHWIGTALSGFGIVYNRFVLADLGLPEPQSFSDLTDPRYRGLLALSDPRQSGSVTTTYESILNKEGWIEGWRILRDMAANSRYFATSATRPPVDVAQGEAAAGLAIDFYGRSEGQALKAGFSASPGTTDALLDRVGYIDPRGAVYIDADPVSILRACPHPALARQFVEFCLSEEGQSLWQMHATSTPAGKDNPLGSDGRPLGPRINVLRRMPVRQAMYDPKYLDHYVDRVNPFQIAAKLPNRGWRSSISLMFGCFAADLPDELRAAWDALTRARTELGPSSPIVLDMERSFYAFPTRNRVEHIMAERFPGTALPPNAALDFSDAITDGGDPRLNPKNDDNCKRIVSSWADAALRSRLKIVYTEFFRENYQRVVSLAESTH